MRDFESTYYNLIAKHLKGALEADEKQVLIDWLAEEPARQQIVDELSAIWTKTDQNEIIPPDPEMIWKGVSSQIHLESSRTKLRHLRTWMAAAAAILIGVVSWVIVVNNGAGSHQQYATLNEVKEINLPDGSLITLNEFSRLSYRQTNKGRKVNLSGEAVFEVSRNEELPFTVKTKFMDTRVLGTVFVVSAYERGQEASVSVIEGKVAVSDKKQNENVLSANQKVIVRNKTMMKVDTWEKDENQMSWYDHSFIFQNESLKEVSNQLKKVYGKQWHFEDSGIANCRFTGVFENASLEEILETIQYALSLDITIDGDEVKISGVSCKDRL